MAGDTGIASSLYRQLDEARASSYHWLTVLTAGMGFFTDAYDLFIIGTVTSLLTPIWHLTTTELSLLNAISLLASVAGALLFGRLMDRLGRKAMYGVEVSLLTAGAIASAFAWGFLPLFIFRILVGVGVGGDYATSGVISAEYANRRDRGRMVGTVFAMQGFGLLAGPLIASILLSTGLSHALDWRLMLGLGAIPAGSVIYLRRKLRETPRFSLKVRGDLAATAETVRLVTGQDAAVAAAAGATPAATGTAVMAATAAVQTSRGPAATGDARAASGRGTPVPVGPGAGGRSGVRGQDRPATHAPARPRLTDRPYLLRLIGTAGCWFLLDIAFYGNSVSNPLILKALQPSGSLLSHTLLAGLIFLVAAVPGYWLAVAMLDRIGRRRIQWIGFLVMAAAFAVIALVPEAVQSVWTFLILYGVSYFFTEFGPNMTTFVYPSEVFATELRGAGDGISAGAGKTGAFLGALLVPHLLQAIGLHGVMGIMAGISLIGILLTLVALPETKGLSLEEAAAETPVRGDAAGPAPRGPGHMAFAGGGDR